ncbi:MAG: hypothetical protein ACK2UH_01660, partial [Candidatus Promineifilaceae bacterium]
MSVQSIREPVQHTTYFWWTDIITILNTLPEASNVLLSPGTVSSTQDLSVSYDYSDADGDDEEDTLVRWYVDRGSGLGDAGVTGLTLNRSYTHKGDHWLARVTPHDGDGYGSPVESSNTVTVGNSAPSFAVAPTIGPAEPTSTTDLTVSYVFSDPDGDGENGTTYAWYIDR